MRAVAVLSLLMGCSVSKDTRLVDLSAEELARVCGDLSGPETFLCEQDGIYVQFTIGEDCEARHTALPEDCPATVGDLARCDKDRRDAYDEDPCRTDAPESCAVLDGCLL